MNISKENFRKAMLFGLAVRKACKEWKENTRYLFDCPVCGETAEGKKHCNSYTGRCYGCGMKLKNKE